MVKSHFFDIDTLIKLENQAWVVDKNNPNIPIMKISKSDFNLIQNGIYRKQNNKIEFNGKLFWLPTELVNKLKMRLVTTGRIMYGGVSERHNQVMLMPSFVKKIGNVPYAELSIGIENIFKVLRVDLVWRMTHNTPGISPLGVRANFSFNF